MSSAGYPSGCGEPRSGYEAIQSALSLEQTLPDNYRSVVNVGEVIDLLGSKQGSSQDGHADDQVIYSYVFFSSLEQRLC